MATETDTIGRATYSPEDNKLRLYPDSRLPEDMYRRVKSAGFIWAPKQELFVAPAWSPNREDLLVELCGEIGDEDTSLAERAEQRADRFQDYSESRADDAAAAQKAVESICDGIPLGQPILVGHHSERHARKDAERIENGMRRAVKMWETAEYWKRRAAGAVSAAKYKERPDVRARRIKTIEAEKRKEERNKAEAEHWLRFWSGGLNLVNKATGAKRPLEMTEENRPLIVHYLGNNPGCRVLCPRKEGDKPDFDQQPGAWEALSGHYPTLYAPRTVAEVRDAAIPAYQRTLARLDRWLAHYANRLQYERAMLAADGGTVTDRKGPEVGGGCRCWASPRGGWSWIVKVNRVSVTVLDNWGNGGGNFTRTMPFDKLAGVMTRAEVEQAKAAGTLRETLDKTGFFLTSDYTKPEPAKPKAEPAPVAAAVEAMRETLKAGVQVVSAPNLFPTPASLAARVAELADLTAGDKVLEPSAGTGALVQAVRALGIFREDVTAVEVNRALADRLQDKAGRVVCADFLECNGDLGKFDKVVTNPPFDHGSDIRHIEHALTFLNPGGRLVAICANGPRQREALQSRATHWEDLPAGTFKEQGTTVNTALVVIDV